MNLLIDSTVKVSLIVLVALVARALLRRRSAAVRHWVLSVAIVIPSLLPDGVAPASIIVISHFM